MKEEDEEEKTATVFGPVGTVFATVLHTDNLLTSFSASISGRENKQLQLRGRTTPQPCSVCVCVCFGWSADVAG